MLPKPKSKYGYSNKEIRKICKERKIPLQKFWATFGVNTVTVEKGENRYYQCDVERTLWELNSKDGKYHTWD